ncbi:MAG: MmgE/PrpD family protein [Rhodospirillales bacterium]|nr:MmgE/PrpD family protein [Rhodospirillales bacterium]
MTFTTEQLADFASGVEGKTLPQSLLDVAELVILDTIAAVLGGVPTSNAAITREAARHIFGDGTSSVWFCPDRLRKAGAVFANCAAASALDIDDGHRGASGHPGAAIVPAVLAEAFECNAAGIEILTAVIVGYDVALRVASARRRNGPMSYASGRWAGYGVAAAIGRLRRLPTETLAHGIAITGAESPQNLPQGDSGTTSSVKGSSPWSTVTAFAAVDRAERGATGPIDLLDRESVYDVSAIVSDLGRRWSIEEIYLKPYASCRYTHPVIDAILALVGDEPSPTNQIDRLVVDVFPEARKIPNETAPQTLEGAQFSLPFSAALAALRGGAAFRPMREDCLTDSEVVSLARRVEVIYADEFAGMFPERTPARVTIHSHGRHASKTVMHPWGDVANPMDKHAVERKLHDLAAGRLSGNHADALVAAVSELVAGDAEGLFHRLSVPILSVDRVAPRVVPE